VSDQLYRRRVKEVMSRQVVTISVNDKVHDALELMMENRVSALPVVDHRGRCVGILSTSDFVDVTYELDEGLSAVEHQSEIWWRLFVKNVSQNIGQQSLMDMMTEDVISSSPDDLVVKAASTMLRERVHRLPVLDNERRLLGIISTTDVLRAMVEAAPHK
jgi:CBS domain-containing protein